MQNEVYGLTIANGASLSGAVELRNSIPVAILMPAAWTAAGLSLQGSVDGSNFFDIHSDTAEITLTAAVDLLITFDIPAMSAMKAIKIRSGTSGTPVNQGAARTLYLICIPK